MRHIKSGGQALCPPPIESLEVETSAELNGPVATDAGDLPKQRVSHGGIDTAESTAVESVQELGPQLEAGAFPEPDILLQPEVLVPSRKVPDISVAECRGSQA